MQRLETRRAARRLTQAEFIISIALRTGVILCSVIFALGILVTWLRPHSLESFSKQILPTLFSGRTVAHLDVPVNFSQFYSGVMHLDPTAIIATGLMLLILLPAIRVALTALVFLYERDDIYFVITLFVLSVLLASIFLGKAL